MWSACIKQMVEEMHDGRSFLKCFLDKNPKVSTNVMIIPISLLEKLGVALSFEQRRLDTYVIIILISNRLFIRNT